MCMRGVNVLYRTHCETTDFHTSTFAVAFWLELELRDLNLIILSQVVFGIWIVFITYFNFNK